MVPVAIAYKVTGHGANAMHFIAGKVMREFHIDDAPKEIRPWVLKKFKKFKKHTAKTCVP